MLSLHLTHFTFFYYCYVTAGVLVVYFDQTSHTTHEGDGSVTLVLRTNVAGGPPNGSVVFYTEDSSATGMHSTHTMVLRTSYIYIGLYHVWVVYTIKFITSPLCIPS